MKIVRTAVRAVVVYFAIRQFNHRGASPHSAGRKHGSRSARINAHTTEGRTSHPHWYIMSTWRELVRSLMLTNIGRTVGSVSSMAKCKSISLAYRKDSSIDISQKLSTINRRRERRGGGAEPYGVDNTYICQLQLGEPPITLHYSISRHGIYMWLFSRWLLKNITSNKFRTATEKGPETLSDESSEKRPCISYCGFVCGVEGHEKATICCFESSLDQTDK